MIGDIGVFLLALCLSGSIGHLMKCLTFHTKISQASLSSPGKKMFYLTMYFFLVRSVYKLLYKLDVGFLIFVI